MNAPGSDRDAGASPGADPAPDISVVIPTYGRAAVLSECLDALMGQDYDRSRYEVIVVDDGSADETAGVVKRYAGTLPAVRYAYQANQGPAAARNHGARLARGAVVMFTDDDCVPTPTWISEMARPFLDPGAGIAGVKGAYRTRQTGPVPRFVQAEFESRYRQLRDRTFIDFVDTYAAAFRRDTFLDLGGFDTRFPQANNEDVDFSYRMASAGHKMVFNPAAVVYHRHPEGLIRYLRVKFGRAYWRMVVYRAYPQKMKADSYTPQTLKAQIGLIVLALLSLAGAPFWRPFLFLLVALSGLFLLTLIPFLVGMLDGVALDRVVRGFRRVNRLEGLNAWVRRRAEAWARSPLRQGFGWAARAVRRGADWGLRLCRRAATGFLRSGVARGLRAVALAVIFGLAFLARGVWSAAGMPRRAILGLARLVGAGRRWWAGLPWVRRVRRVRDRILGFPLFMLPVAVVLLFLRAGVMAAGVLWGLRAQHAASRRFSHAVILFVGDAAAIALSCVGAYYFKRYILDVAFGSPDVPMGFKWHYVPFVVGVFGTAFLLSGLYKPRRGIAQVNEFVLLVRTVGYVGVVFAVLIYLLGMRHTRLILLPTLINVVVGVSLLRAVLRRLLDRSGAPAGEASRVLIAGTNELGRLIARRLENDRGLDARIVGFASLSAEDVGRRIDGHEVLGTVDDLKDVVARFRVKEVFLCVPALPRKDVLELVDRHSTPGVRFHVASNLFDLVTAEVDMADGLNIPLASLRNEHAELLYLAAKRILDVGVAFAFLVLTFPMWVLVMLAIKLETDGPAVFSQDRVGKDGRVFRIRKFRTMYADSAAFAYSPSSAEDRRVTRVGRFLRSTSLDELPQFLNVLKGEMSLVGPRPEMPFIVETYSAWERKRLEVKPGLTGLWQIMGRKDLPLHESLEYDFYYIKNRSFLLDISILLKTIPVLFSGRGAY